MLFECGNCEGQIDAPDELGGSVLPCPHCGQEIVVPVPEDTEFAEPEGTADMSEAQPGVGGGFEPHHPITPQEFRLRMEEKKKRRRIIFGSVAAVLLIGGIVSFLVWGESAAMLARGLQLIGKDPADVMVGKRGWAPQGFALANELPGMTGRGGAWKLDEMGKTYLVVELVASPALFLPSEAEYAEMKNARLERFRNDPSYTPPPLARCRVFNPSRFTLTWDGAAEAIARVIAEDAARAKEEADARAEESAAEAEMEEEKSEEKEKETADGSNADTNEMPGESEMPGVEPAGEKVDAEKPGPDESAEKKAAVALITDEEGKGIKGSLINIHYAGYKGFYDSFQLFGPSGSGPEEERAVRDAEKEMEKPMTISVAFVVPKVERTGMVIQLDGGERQEVPAVNRAIKIKD